MINHIQRFGRILDLSLTILPTLECNFRCVYCYEAVKKNEIMDKNVQTKVVKMIERGVGILKNLHITWMGGEPLLCFGIIDNLSQKILEICAKGSIKYSAGIITNGYLLRSQMFRKMIEEMKIDFFK